MSKKPIPPDLLARFAELHVDLPDGITLGQAHKLMQYLLDRMAQDTGNLGNVPNDFARMARERIDGWGIGKTNIRAAGKHVAELTKRENLRRGSVVMRKGRPHFVWEIRPSKNDIFLWSVEDDRMTICEAFKWAKNAGASVATSRQPVIYTPPITHDLAELSFARLSLNETFREYIARTLPLRSTVAAALTPDQWFQNEYGFFWQREAVRRAVEVINARVAEPSPELPPISSEALTPKQQLEKCRGKKGFCRYCATAIMRASFEKCATCLPSHPKSAKRFCLLCGEELIGVKGRRHRTALLCPTCR